MSQTDRNVGEGNLQAPTRHPVAWQDPDFHAQDKLYTELERVFDHCHGCRRCVSLCNAFPTLFDLVDTSATLEVDGVAKDDYWKVVDHCYLCDLCYMTKCPYTPPHEWNIDFPHLMLRAKSVKFRQGKVKLRDRLLTSTDAMGRFCGIPVVAQTINAVNRSKPARQLLDKAVGIDASARLPEFHSNKLRNRLANRPDLEHRVQADGRSRGRVALFATCYGNVNEPLIGEDLVAVFEHNGIPVCIAEKEQCCGMPKMELGDLESVAAAKDANIPVLAAMIDAGWDIVAPVPSCVLMFRKELPLLFPDDAAVKKVSEAIFDPFEYLMLRHQAGFLKTDFKQPLGKVTYHAACHQRVQNVGRKTRDILALVPDTTIETIERCSGHDGTYAVKSEFHQLAVKIGRPIVRRIEQQQPDHYGSDCPMAGHHIESILGTGQATEHPMSLLRMAYGI